MRDAQGRYSIVRRGQTIEELFDEEGGALPDPAESRE
jgi:hypothetical protein